MTYRCPDRGILEEGNGLPVSFCPNRGQGTSIGWCEGR